MGSNWKISLLAVVLGLGLCFEVFKHLPMGQRLLKRDNGQTISSDPYALKSTRLQGGRLAVQSNRASARPLIIASTIPTQLIGTSEKDMNEEKSGAKDPTVALEKKKKKKKKKKTEEAEIVAEPMPELPKETDKRSKPTVSYADSYTLTKVAPQTVTQLGEKKPETLTFEEWVKILLDRPDPAALEDFIAAHKSGKVSDDIYYRVIDMMLKDSREEMRLQGVTALDKSPSTASFYKLAEVSRANSTSADMRQKAEAALEKYTDVKHLSILRSVLTAADNPEYTMMAAQMVKTALQKYQTTNPPPSANPTAQQMAKYTRPFQPFVSVLQTLSASPEANVAAQAKDTLAALQSFLGTNNNPPATAEEDSQPDNGAQASL